MNPLIKKFGDEARWVNYKIVTREGKQTKLPYSITGKLASSIDPKTWSTYAKVKAKSEQVGIVFTPDKKLLGIDIDHCLKDNKIEHEDKEKIADLILEADTYTEVSVSNTGIHLYLWIEEKSGLSLQSNRRGSYECYTEGRYFVFTGASYGEQKEIRTVSKEEAEKLLAILGYPWKATKQEQVKQPPSNVSLDDATVLHKMFSAKNGDKTKNLYEGDTTLYNKDDSIADMSLCSHLAFWTGRNAEQMERLWLASPLGQREKTKDRQDYRTRTIVKAIENCKEVYSNGAMKVEKENPDLDLLYTINSQKDKVFTQNTENICRVLRKHADFQGRIRYDAFRNIIEILPKGGTWRMMEDNDAVNIQTAISILFSFFGKVGKDMVFDAMMKVAKENTFDSAIDYVTKLRWDGTQRLDSWLSTVYGAPDDVYHRAVGSNWLKGLVKRIVQPGCKFDYVIVLEGEQGSKKSMSLYILGGGDAGSNNWHVETTMSTDSKDFFMQFAGKAIIEFSEGETLNRTEVKKMKAIITTQSDRYRPSYGRVAMDFPRRCVFAMTTNQEEYLKDETGNRRWLPVKVEKEEADVEWLEANRDQLFAEAYHRVANLKEKIYEFPKEETLEAQSQRQIHDENSEIVHHWYLNKLTATDRNNGITCSQVYRDAINGGYSGIKAYDRWQEMKIANVLRDVLKLVKRRKMIDGVQSNRWFQESAEDISKEVLTTEQKLNQELINF